MKKRVIMLLIFAVIAVAVSARGTTPKPTVTPVFREPRPASPLSPPPITPMDEAVVELIGRQYEHSEYYRAEAISDGWMPEIIELYLDTDSRYESSNTGRFTLTIGLAADININARTRADAIRKRNSINVPEVNDMWALHSLVGTYERIENREIDNETYVLAGYIRDIVNDIYMPAPDGSNPDRIIHRPNVNTNIYFSYDYDKNAVRLWSFGEMTPKGAVYIDWFTAEKFSFDTTPLLLTSSQIHYSRIFYPDADESDD